MTTVKFDDILKKELQNPSDKADFDEAYNKLESAYALLKARESAGLTQRELASVVKIPQSTVARIERGDNTSIETLQKIAHALGKHLKITIA